MKATKEIILFCCSLIFATYFQWNLTDLVWSFWTASFIVGYLTIISSVFILPREAYKGMSSSYSKNIKLDKESPAKKWFFLFMLAFVPALFIIPFFTVHFGGFHSVHAIFLNEFAPIENILIVPPKFISWFPFFHKFPDLPRLLAMYWPIVLAVAINEFNPAKKENSVDTTEKQKKNNFKKNAFLKPYTNVMKIHFLIFILAGMKFMQVDGMTMYMVTFSLFFFPFGKVFKRK